MNREAVVSRLIEKHKIPRDAILFSNTSWGPAIGIAISPSSSAEVVVGLLPIDDEANDDFADALAKRYKKVLAAYHWPNL